MPDSEMCLKLQVIYKKYYHIEYYITFEKDSINNAAAVAAKTHSTN